MVEFLDFLVLVIVDDLWCVGVCVCICFDLC